MDVAELDALHRLVGQVFAVRDFTLGRPQDGFFLRYRGRLTMESATAYERLAAALRPLEITPLFRLEEGDEVIYLVEGVIRPQPGKAWVNLLLFGLTVWSVLFAGALMAYGEMNPTASSDWIWQQALHNPFPGWPFALSLLAILLAHEFGHYFAGRRHGTAVTLPYFIPMPLSFLGTMGAFIQMKDLPKNRRALLDIAIAGPLAGLIVAVPITLYGLSVSQLGVVNSGFLEGNSILYLLAKYAVFGRWLPEPLTYGGLPPALYWLRYFFTGQPVPLGGTDVYLSTIALAGWAGILVTAMNLIPIGQLDGGHIFYVLAGRRADRLRPIVLLLLGLLGLFWSGWWWWAFLLVILGGRHAEPLDQITPLDARRRWLAVLALVIFVLVFSPVPFVPLS